jgi:hypothetical protein
MKKYKTLEELIQSALGKSNPHPDPESLWADMNARLDAAPGAEGLPSSGNENPPPGQSIPVPSPSGLIAGIFIAGSLIFGFLWLAKDRIPANKTASNLEMGVAPAPKVEAPVSAMNNQDPKPSSSISATTEIQQNKLAGTEKIGSNIAIPETNTTKKTSSSAKNTSSTNQKTFKSPDNKAPLRAIKLENSRPFNRQKTSDKTENAFQKGSKINDAQNTEPTATTIISVKNEVPGQNPKETSLAAETTNASVSSGENTQSELTDSKNQATFWPELSLLSYPNTAITFANTAPQPGANLIVPIHPIEKNSVLNQSKFLVMLGYDLEKTKRLNTYGSPPNAKLNLGVGCRVAINEKWSVQGEGWFQQLATPKIVQVIIENQDIDSERIIREDTLSVSRMSGLSLSASVVRHLPFGFSASAGLSLARFHKVLTENGYSETSLVTGNFGRGSGYSYDYVTPPSWFRQIQPGIKIGVEKLLFKRWLLGLQMYQGLADISKFSTGGANLSTNWILNAGYIF